MPLQATSGAASYDAFGGGAAAVPQYIEDVFQTWLYQGNDTGQTITNGIDLSTKGGLVWTKRRNGVLDHFLLDTARGGAKSLQTNTTNGQTIYEYNGYITSYNTTGYTLGDSSDLNGASNTYASWTFREAPKFFDVVTYTGTGTGTRTLNHNLGSAPGFYVIKRTDGVGSWWCYHRSLGINAALTLENTNAVSTFSAWQTPTSTTFGLGTSSFNVNGATYVAYLFAHDAGGFGLTGTDNVISCGSFTTDGSGIIPTVNLGYEPQWILAKPSSGTGNWFIMDNMRGWYNQQADQGNALFPNTSGAEAVGYNAMIPTATGFTGPAVNFGAGVTYIYIAIRRGPMRTPTTGTSVFAPIAATTGTQTTGFPIDMMMQFWRTSNDIYANTEVVDRLRGVSSNSTAQSRYLLTTSTGAEDSLGSINASLNWTNTGFDVPPAYAGGSNGFECFRRAPGFFDEVCYTGDLTARTINHNLTVAPEMMIVKSRSVTGNWQVFHKDLNALGTETADDSRIRLNSDAAATANNVIWNSTLPTATVFSVGVSSDSNASGVTFVNYLFASCPGVSKVGSYTGNGSSQTINCGFTGGARFVMIKRTDSTGDWVVFDTARGIVAGNDPFLLLNSTAAEITGFDNIDPASSGFVINQVNNNRNLNVSGATYIFLAIA